MVLLELAFPYRDGRGQQLRFASCLVSRGNCVTLYTGQTAYPVALNSEEVVRAFTASQSAQAELAFEAIVLGEPWRLERIFQSH